MQQSVLDKIKLFIVRNRNNRIFRKCVHLLCCIVVFITTYALILPAITMEHDAFCGMQEHLHTEACAQVTQATVLSCSPEALGIHTHTDECYSEEGSLLCTHTDYAVHSHDSLCFGADGTLVCKLPEHSAHQHTEVCYTSGEPSLHVHTDSCYIRVRGDLLCTQKEYAGHSHTGDCYTPGETLTCTLAENHTHAETCYILPLTCGISTAPHTHQDTCYESGELLCSIPESHTHDDGCRKNMLTCLLSDETHQHEDGCYHTETVCQIPENHQHKRSCYQTVTTCSVADMPVHVHGAACYGNEPRLDCQLAENHIHGSDCYQQLLTCTVPEDPGHSHQDSCYQQATSTCCGYEEGDPESADPVLACTEPDVPVHSHTDACFQSVETSQLYICGITAEDHVHTASCCGCGMEEHSHTLVCFSDPEADVETVNIWEATVSQVTLTGDLPGDVVAVAQSQIGYSESSRNYVVGENNRLFGYTRYGAWYGEPYGEWSGMFASFCLNYAGVEGIPYNSDVSTWVSDLITRGFYFSARETLPQTGNLIFFDQDHDGMADHAGIVADVQQAQEHSGASIKTIEGDSANTVRYQHYTPDDPSIAGYCLLPGQARIPVAENPIEENTRDELLDILVCGTPVHTHDVNCHNAEGLLICTKKEHVHTGSCINPSSPVGYAGSNIMMRTLRYAQTRETVNYHKNIKELLSLIQITDSNGGIIFTSEDFSSGSKEIILGNHYNIQLQFTENSTNQFDPQGDGTLHYQIPDNLKCEKVEDGVILAEIGGIEEVVAHYTISDNELVVTPSGSNYFNAHHDAYFEIIFSAEAVHNSDNNDMTIDFNGMYEVTVNVKENGSLIGQKDTLSYNPLTRTITYQCTVTAVNGSVNIYSVSDWWWSNKLGSNPEDPFTREDVTIENISLVDSDGNNLSNQWNIVVGNDKNIWSAPYQEYYLDRDKSIILTYDVKLDSSLSENFTYENHFEVYGSTPQNPNVFVNVTEYTDIVFSNLKKTGSYVVEEVNGIKQDALEWTVTIGNTQQETVSVTDTLGEGQTFCNHKPLNIKATRADGTVEYLNVAWTSITCTEDNTEFTYTLPSGYVDYTLTYYSHYTVPQGVTDYHTFENNITTNILGADRPTTGTGTAEVLGVPPSIDKVVASADNESVTFRITCFMPAKLYNQTGVMVYDDLASWGNVGGYILNNPQELNVTVVTQDGTNHELAPYDGQQSPDGTYLLETLGQTFNMYFNTGSSTSQSSVWKFSEDTQLIISYHIPLDSPMLDGWGGNPTNVTLSQFLKETGQGINNDASLQYSNKYRISDSVHYVPVVAPPSTLSKTGESTDTDGEFTYSIWFSSGLKESSIFDHITENDVTKNDVDTFVLTDVFDSRMEYVPDSFEVKIWQYWNHQSLHSSYALPDGAEPANGAHMTVSASDLLPKSGSTYDNLLTAIQNLPEGYQYEFIYKLKVKDGVKNQATEGVLTLDNSADITWTNDTHPDGVTYDANTQVTYHTGIVRKTMNRPNPYTNQADFTIVVNPNAVDLAPDADRYVIDDVMSSNLSLLYNTLVVEVLNNQGNVDYQLMPEECQFTYNPDKNSLSLILPDEKTLRIKYSCNVSGVEEEAAKISNRVEVLGYSAIQDVYDTEFRVNGHMGQAGGSYNSFSLMKQDGITHNALSNVAFKLYGDIPSNEHANTDTLTLSNGKILYYYQTYETGANGIVTVSNTQLTQDHLYALVEIAPPTGYIALDEPYLFYMEYLPNNVSVQADVIADGMLFVIKNYPQGIYELPDTGGIGSQIYYAWGTLLGCAAIFLLYSKSRGTGAYSKASAHSTANRKEE